MQVSFQSTALFSCHGLQRGRLEVRLAGRALGCVRLIGKRAGLSFGCLQSLELSCSWRPVLGHCELTIGRKALGARVSVEFGYLASAHSALDDMQSNLTSTA